MKNKIWRKYETKTLLTGFEQYCTECFERVSFVQPCPVCRGSEEAKEVYDLGELTEKGEVVKTIEELESEYKTCFVCKEKKKLTDFAKGVNAKNGRINKCKKCVNKKALERKRRLRNEKKI